MKELFPRSNRWGQLEAVSLAVAGPTVGKTFVVLAGTNPNYDKLSQLLDYDKEGVGRIFPTLDAAIGACVANRGDVIHVLPGHSESVTAADGVDLDVVGVTVIGHGRGSDRPTFTFDTAITAQMQVAAANVTLQNLVLENGIDNLTNALNIDAANCLLKDIETVDNDSNYHCDDFIVTTANADDLKIKGWKHKAASGKTGAQTALSIVGGDNIEVDDFDVDGDFAVAAIENVTTAATNLKVGAKSQGNLARTRNAADVIFTAVATTTGFVDNIFSRLLDDAANITEALVGADMQFGPNLPIVNADGEQALQWNGSASTDA